MPVLPYFWCMIPYGEVKLKKNIPMKKSIFVLLAMLTGVLAAAQDGSNGFLLSGSVIYEQIMKLNIQLEGDAAQFADVLPRERKSEKVLHFTEEASLYENHHTEDPEEALDMHHGGNVMIKMAEPDNKTYTDLKEGLQIEQKEFMSRSFLIESDLPKGNWKLTGQQKMILEYPCQEAISGEDEKLAIAWFTPAIPVAAGPDRYGNLPGLVLEVILDGGDNTITAKSIELKEPDEAQLKKPAKGKKVTKEEYQAIVEEKMKEMGVEHGAASGSNQTVVIRIHQ